MRTVTTQGCLLLALAGLISAPMNLSAQQRAVHWGPCEQVLLTQLGYQCAKFRRPLDRQRPKGTQVELALFRLPSTGTLDQKIGTLFFNPGGPGQSGHGSAYKGALLPESLRSSFDFVTWDPRGLGKSTPTLENCSVGMPNRPATGKVNWQVVLNRRQNDLASANSDCIRRHRDLIQGMGTVEVAHDLDDLRNALGDEKLTFWGISYGTVIGSTYAALFPNRVRAMVLDGSVDPWTDLSGMSSSAIAPDDAIRFYLQLYPDLKPTFNRVMNALDLQPLILPDGSYYTRWDLLDPLTSYIHISRLAGTYGRTLIETADRALFGVAEDQEIALKQLQNPLLRSPKVDSNAAAGFAAVICQDFPQRPSLNLQKEQLKSIIGKAPLYGGSLGVNFLALCAGYEDLPPSSPVPRAPFADLSVPGLITGATWDAATPLMWSTEMARAFPAMRTLSSVGNEHGIFLNSQSHCVEKVVSTYLLTAVAPPLDQSCEYVAPAQQQAFE